MRSTIILFFLILFSIISEAQNWISANGISGESVKSIIKYNGDTLLAGVLKNGIFISYDNGNNWTQFALQGKDISSLIKIGKSIIAGTEGNDIYRTASIFSTWQNVIINNLVIYSLTVHKDTIYACTAGSTGPGGIYTTVDAGKTWTQYGTIPPFAFLQIDFSPNGRVFAATPYGAYYCDNQLSWVATTGLGSVTTRTVSYLGNDSIIYGNDEGIYLSINNGISTKKLNNTTGFYSTVFYIEDTLYATNGSDNNLTFKSKRDTVWQSVAFDKYISSLIKSDNTLIAGTPDGIYIKNKNVVTNVMNKVPTANIFLTPNPSRDILKVSGINSEIIQIEIFNSAGQIVKIENNSTINITGFVNGIYFYKIKSKERFYFGKIIKE